MFLASASRLREELGFSENLTDFIAAADAALHAAEPYCANALDTDFRLATYEDHFFVAEPGIQQGLFTATEFRLRRGFVRQLLVFEHTPDPAAIGTPGALSVMERAVWDADAMERGSLKDLRTPYRYDMVRVAYIAGFNTDDANPDSFDLDQVPAWLQEAALCKARALLADNPALTEGGVTIDKALQAAQCDAILTSHRRYAPLAIQPV